jgi:hypothetical protein
MGAMSDERRVPRAWGYAAGWLVAAALAVAVGVLAVTSLGASIRDRGPVVTEAVRDAQVDAEGELTPAADATAVRETFTDDFGSFAVECRDAVAYGLRVEPAAGWRTVSYDRGPDDDVDAVLARRAESVEIEVFCNRGRPAIGEVERNTLPEDDD